MMATRTLAVSSALGAMFLLHGCGDKKEEKPANTQTGNTDAPADDAPAPPSAGTGAQPSSVSSGSWGDVESVVAGMSKNKVANFVKEYLNNKVTVDTNPDGKLFPKHATKTTISVILNDWKQERISPCTQHTLDDLKEAFGDEDAPAVNKFGLLYEYTQDREYVYVADPRIAGEQSDFTKAVFYKVNSDKSKVPVRDDGDSKMKDIKPDREKGDLRMNMLVVFTADNLKRRPYRNFNNFGIAVISPQDVSSPKEVYEAARETFDIVYTVIGAAKKIQDRKEDEFEFKTEWKKFKTTRSGEDEKLELNWWGAYQKDGKPFPTGEVGAQSPAFGKSKIDDETAVSNLQDISKQMKKLFSLREEIMLGQSMKYHDEEALHKHDTAYCGVCAEITDRDSYKAAIGDDYEDFETDEREKDYLQAVNDLCVPHPKHANSLYFRVKAVADKENIDFGKQKMYLKPSVTDPLKLRAKADEIQTLYIYTDPKIKQILHEIMYVEYIVYAMQVHRVQNAILAFYHNYTEDPKKKTEGETIVMQKDSTKEYLHQPDKEFQKWHELTYPQKCVNKDVDGFVLATAGSRPKQNGVGEDIRKRFPWFAKGVKLGEVDQIGESDLSQPTVASKPIPVWGPLFKALALDEGDCAKIVPKSKQEWLDMKKEIKLNDDISIEWRPYKFPSQRYLQNPEIQNIYIGKQSDNADINAAVYAGLVTKFFENIEKDNQKKVNFYLAVKNPNSAKNEYDDLSKGHKKMEASMPEDQADRIPDIILAGSNWSEAKTKAEQLFLEKTKRDGTMDAGF